MKGICLLFILNFFWIVFHKKRGKKMNGGVGNDKA